MLSRVVAIIASLAQPAHQTPKSPEAPLRIAVIGLTHGHVEGLLWRAGTGDVVQIVGVWEPNTALFERLAAKHNVDRSLRHDDLAAMLDAVRPEAASVMTSTRGHLAAVEACAPRGVHVMVEKPLAISNEHADRMADLARRHGVHLLTNYETSWYASVHEAARLTAAEAAFTPIRRAVFRHGHKGPIEIGCAAEFTDWLTDPEQNGAGALFDFGCYGANIMTLLMDGQLPDTVTAVTQTLKPERYPRVDDDATIVLAYPGATAVIQASWAWTHDNKEMDLHTEAGSIHAGRWNQLTVRRPDAQPETATPPPRPHPYGDEWTYLRALVRGQCEVDPLSSLENNLAVVRILDAARRSAGGAGAVAP